MKQYSRRELTGGINTAAEAAFGRHPNLKWLFIFESDNLFRDPSALEKALRLMESVEQIGGLGFTVEKYSGEKTAYNSPFPTVLSFVLGQRLATVLGHNQPSAPPWQETGDVCWGVTDVALGCPLLLRSEAWRAVGPMDERQFTHCDSDFDWCWRAKKCGWLVVIADIPGVIHDKPPSAVEWPGDRVVKYHRARFRLLRKHRSGYIWLIAPLLVFRHLFESLLILAVPSPQRKPKLKARLELLQGALKGYQPTPPV